jgi:hypothetical protein
VPSAELPERSLRPLTGLAKKSSRGLEPAARSNVEPLLGGFPPSPRPPAARRSPGRLQREPAGALSLRARLSPWCASESGFEEGSMPTAPVLPSIDGPIAGLPGQERSDQTGPPGRSSEPRGLGNDDDVMAPPTWSDSDASWPARARDRDGQSDAKRGASIRNSEADLGAHAGQVFPVPPMSGRDPGSWA